MELIKGVPVLPAPDKVIDFAALLMKELPLPDKAAADAFHIAVASANEIDYLLTWNCTHIANAFLRGRIDDLSRRMGFRPSTICTPEELLGR